MAFKLILLTIILFYFVGCSNAEKIEEDKFIKIYTDLLIAQDSLGNEREKFISEKNRIFQRHNISEKNYKKTLQYYSEDITRWNEFFEKTITYLESMKKKEGS